MHEEADAGDDEQHHLCEMIELHAERDLQRLAEINPLHRAVNLGQRPRTRGGGEAEERGHRADDGAEAVIFPRRDEDEHRCDEWIQKDEPREEDSGVHWRMAILSNAAGVCRRLTWNSELGTWNLELAHGTELGDIPSSKFQVPSSKFN